MNGLDTVPATPARFGVMKGATADGVSLALALFVLGAVAFGSRLAWIGTGFGMDPDTYRVLDAARAIRDGAFYEASRFPGYPVYEYLVALLPASPWVLNGLSALATSVSTIIVALILREAKVQDAFAYALAFAMVPIVFLASTMTMDYALALSFILAATWLAQTGRAGAAGMCLGLAIGTRITSGLVGLPLLFLLAATVPGRAHTLRFAGMAAVTGATFYVPVFVTYGLGALTFYDGDPYPTVLQIFDLGVRRVWGEIGAVGWALVVLSVPFWAKQARARLDDTAIRALAWTAGAAVVLFALLFLRLPHDAQYLLPMVPFLIISAALILPLWIGRGLIVVLLVTPWVHFAEGEFRNGAVERAHKARQRIAHEVTHLVTISSRLPTGSMVYVGTNLPQLRMELDEAPTPGVHWLHFPASEAEIRAYRAAGHCVYFAARMDEAVARRGIALDRAGAIEIPERTGIPPDCHFAF